MFATINERVVHSPTFSQNAPGSYRTRSNFLRLPQFTAFLFIVKRRKLLGAADVISRSPKVAEKLA